MEIPARISLEKVPASIQSYYKGKGGDYTPLCNLSGGKLVPEASAALFNLCESVRAQGGTLLVTDAYRSAEAQDKARKKYETWVAAGKPSPRTGAYDKKTMKAAFVSRPGRSNHNAGRAVDLAHMLAAPEDVPSGVKLDWLWALAIPLGWRPIIKDPREGQSEAWHFDFWGELAHIRDRLDYGQSAMAGVLDIGGGVGLYSRLWERWVQAQLHRIGPDVGDIDGYLGKRTRAGMEELGLPFAPKSIWQEKRDYFTPAEKAVVEEGLLALPSWTGELNVT